MIDSFLNRETGVIDKIKKTVSHFEMWVHLYCCTFEKKVENRCVPFSIKGSEKERTKIKGCLGPWCDSSSIQNSQQPSKNFCYYILSSYIWQKSHFKLLLFFFTCSFTFSALLWTITTSATPKFAFHFIFINNRK